MNIFFCFSKTTEWETNNSSRLFVFKSLFLQENMYISINTLEYGIWYCYDIQPSNFQSLWPRLAFTMSQKSLVDQMLRDEHYFWSICCLPRGNQTWRSSHLLHSSIASGVCLENKDWLEVTCWGQDRISRCLIEPRRWISTSLFQPIIWLRTLQWHRVGIWVGHMGDVEKI